MVLRCRLAGLYYFTRNAFALKGENMKIIIVGCGKVGTALTAQLSREDNLVTVIDTDSIVVRNVSNTYDVMGIVGNGASYQVLQEADIEHADLMIAVTKSDEMNLLCCVIAKQAADCHTIARVRNPMYREEREFIRKKLGLSMIINPEHAAAMEMARLLRFPSAIEIDSFSRGRIEMLRFKVPETSKIVHMSLRELAGALQYSLLVCAVERNGEVYIPDGNFVVQAKDSLSIITTPQNAESLFKKIGVHTNKVHNTMIVGGGEITYYLAKSLANMNVDVKIIEKNKDRCEVLSEALPDATVIYGDGSDQELLKEERIQDMDSFVACTDMDEENIILSLYAKEKVSSKVVTKINHLEFNDVIHSLNLDSLIYPKHITAEYILQYVRAMKNSIGSNVETLYKLMEDRVEALEFIVNQNCRMIGIRLQDMKTRPNLLVAAINRQGKVIIPGGQDSFEAGDSVIIVTTETGLQDAGIAARTLGDLRCDRAEQLRHGLLLLQIREYDTTRMGRVLFRLGHQRLHELLHSLRLGNGGLDTLVQNQRRRHVRQHSLAVAGLSAQVIEILIVSHLSWSLSSL